MSVRVHGDVRSALILLGLLIALSLLVPHRAHAINDEGDLFCAAQYCYPGKCTPSPQDPACVPCAAIPCKDVTSGFTTTGLCVSSAPGVCRATGTSGPDGFGLDKVAEMLGGLFQQLMQQAGKGGQQGGSTPSGGGFSGGTGATGCTEYYQTSSVTSDPCAIYVPGTSGSLTNNATQGLSDIFGSIGDLFGTSTSTGTSSGTTTQIGTVTSNIRDTAQTPLETTTGSIVTGGLGIMNATLQNIVPSIQPSQITGGVHGDIAVFETGATVVGGVRGDTSEVAGFIGANTFGDSQGLVANMCRTRPWASNFLSRIISPSFFDGLCSWRGYTVGEPAPQITTPVVTVQQQPVHEVQVSQTTTTPGVEPKVRIWAVPPAVALGARTSIFWDSEGVSDCVVTSPDGSFHHTTVEGAASTVPLTAATTFSISCRAPDGTPVTGFVTVKLAI